MDNSEPLGLTSAVPNINVLRAIRNRVADRPAWYKWALEYDTKWWVTPFTYEQMEGGAYC